MQYASQTTDTFISDRLIAGATQLVFETCTLASGQNLLRGSVVGRITTSGKMTLSTAATLHDGLRDAGIFLKSSVPA